MEVTTRPARPTDAGVLYRMLCELEGEILVRENFDAVFLTNLANENVGYFIAESEGKPIGMASCHVQLFLHHAAPIAEIQEMYVDPAHRSRGVGKHLLEAAAHFAETRGASQLEVTSNSSRHDTHRFYEREGFSRSHFKFVRNGGVEA